MDKYECFIKELEEYYLQDMRRSVITRSLLKQAIEYMRELLKAAKKMHLWIFLHTGDEQKAYDECGLSDEMNAALGYSGQIKLRVEPPKEENDG